jgi:hypothetical protein
VVEYRTQPRSALEHVGTRVAVAVAFALVASVAWGLVTADWSFLIAIFIPAVVTALVILVSTAIGFRRSVPVDVRLEISDDTIVRRAGREVTGHPWVALRSVRRLGSARLLEFGEDTVSVPLGALSDAVAGRPSS